MTPAGRPEAAAARVSPSLRWALSRPLPGREESWLLRAILHRGDTAVEAWRRFSSSVEDLPALFRTDTGGRKRLSPLLLRSVRENGLSADPGLLTILRTAWLREELRADAYHAIAGELYGTLQSAGVPFLVLKGAALAETAYPERCLRHAHDIDLLLPAERVSDAARLLARDRWRGPEPAPGGQGTVLHHESGLPVRLLHRSYRTAFYRSSFATLRARSRTVPIEGSGPVVVPGPADQLVYALGHASYCPGRSTLVWATDAWMIVHGSPGVDWDDFVGAVQEARLELPVCVMAGYLADMLDAPVPPRVMAELDRGASKAGPLARDVALYGARQRRGTHAALTSRLRPAWSDRLTLLRWQLFPSRAYLAWAYGDPPSALLPLIYLTRPFSWLAEALRWKVVGAWRSLVGPRPSSPA